MPGAIFSGRPSHAFDLAADPAEDHNLAASASWASELARALADSLQPLTVPLAEGQTLEMPAEMEEQLRALGYGD